MYLPLGQRGKQHIHTHKKHLKMVHMVNHLIFVYFLWIYCRGGINDLSFISAQIMTQVLNN